MVCEPARNSVFGEQPAESSIFVHGKLGIISLPDELKDRCQIIIKEILST
jgi:hypothetical protein